jgi:hypothetical protein
MMTYTDSARLDSNKASNQFLAVLFYQLHNIACNLSSSGGRVPQKNYAESLLAVGINQLAKVLIFCQEDPLFANCKPYNLGIFCPWTYASNRKDIVTLSLKGSDHFGAAVFIGEETHVYLRAARLGDFKKTVSSCDTVSAA